MSAHPFGGRVPPRKTRTALGELCLVAVIGLCALAAIFIALAPDSLHQGLSDLLGYRWRTPS